MPSGWLTYIYITLPVFSSHQLRSIFSKKLQMLVRKYINPVSGENLRVCFKKTYSKFTSITLTLFFFKVHLQVLTENHRALHLMVN